MEEKTFFNGNWKAVEKIGEGTFGIVYKAEKVQSYGVKSYSAIKQILIPHSEKEYMLQKSEGMTQSDIEKSYDNQVKKWIAEVDFLNQFKGNANIVTIEDFEVLERIDKPGRIINIKMELLHSIEDNELNKILTDKKVLKMALDILNALEECEEKNVVHRDIKPDNVFVDDRGVFKLGDFGEAKNIEKTVSNMSKRGTENYMAPEIYKGERGSKSVDTYSLGIMLYKYFNNNRIPFLPDYPDSITYEDRENALYKRMSGEEMKAPVKASNNIAKIILKACSYNAKDRYKSATDLKKDIESEYKALEKPVNLFDFQQEEIKQEEKKSHNKTMPLNEGSVKEEPKIENPKKEEPDIPSSDKTPKSKKEDNLNGDLIHEGTISVFSDYSSSDDEDKKDYPANSPKVDTGSDLKEPDKKEVKDKKEEPVKPIEIPNNKLNKKSKSKAKQKIDTKDEELYFKNKSLFEIYKFNKFFYEFIFWIVIILGIGCVYFGDMTFFIKLIAVWLVLTALYVIISYILKWLIKRFDQTKKK